MNFEGSFSVNKRNPSIVETIDRDRAQDHHLDMDAPSESGTESHDSWSGAEENEGEVPKRWHEVQALAVRDPVTGKEVCEV